MPDPIAYATVLAVVAVTTLLATFVMRRVAWRVGAVARPDERHVHEQATPVLGGSAMVIGLLVGLATAWAMPAFAPVFDGTTEPFGVAIAGVIIWGVGLIDDLRDVSAPAKVAGNVLAASVLVISGVSILVFRIPFGGLWLLSGDLSFLISVLWVLGMCQAVNLIDGLDGLAAGIVAIASATFFIYAMQLADEGLLHEDSLAPVLAIIVLGMALGFLPHNVHAAKIFMGDSGALLLGLLMAAATMLVGGRTEEQFSGQTYFFFAPMFIPLFILGVPIVDTAFAIVRRATKRTGISDADKDHLHHRLLRLGHGHRRSVLILWAWTALLSGFVLYPTLTGNGDGLVPIGAAALGLALYTLLHPNGRRRTEAGGAPDDAADSSGDAPPTPVEIDAP